MPLTRCLCSALLCASLVGCGVAYELARNTADQFEYHDVLERMRLRSRNRALARDAWNEFRSEDGDASYSDDFERGFQDGFVSYSADGAEEPPVVPPRRYFRVSYETPEGHADIEDWFTGYRYGVIAAQQAGCRELVLVPTAPGAATPRGTVPIEEEAQPVPALPSPDRGVMEEPERLPPPGPAVPRPMWRER
jgi:hypothetical protein